MYNSSHPDSSSTFEAVERMLKAYYWVIKSVSQRRGMLRHTLHWTQGLLMSCSPLMYPRDSRGPQEPDARMIRHHNHALVRHAESQLYEMCGSVRRSSGYLQRLVEGGDTISMSQIQENLDNLEHEFTLRLLHELASASHLAGLACEVYHLAEECALDLRRPTRSVMERVKTSLCDLVERIAGDDSPEPFRSSLAKAGLYLGQTAVRADVWLANVVLSGCSNEQWVAEMRSTLERVAEDMQRLVYLVIVEINRLSLVNLQTAKVRVRDSDLEVIREHVEIALAATAGQPSGRWTPALRRCLTNMRDLTDAQTRPSTTLRLMLIEHEAAARLLRAA